MKSRFIICLLLVLGFCPVWLYAEAPASTSPENPGLETLVEAVKAANGSDAAKGTLPGVVLSESISQITGTAVSPLLGMTAVGAWKYFNTPEAERHLLPWYCHHYVWGTFGVILLLCFLKDSLGAAVPALVKKPLDFAELFEDKFSALLVSGAFVPFIAGTIARMGQGAALEGAAVFDGSMGLAAMPLAAILDSYWLKMAVLLPFCLGAFFVVWLACHSINVIIAMSPFGLVDLSLKLFKLTLLGVITLAAFISPYLGLLVCLPLIIVAFLISGWTFRLTVFGAFMGYDVLLRRKAAAEEIDGGVWGFNAKEIGNVPVRSFGRITLQKDGRLHFEYRPWLVMPCRDLVLGEEINGVERGVLFPSVMSWTVDDRGRREMILLPRYTGCVPQVASALGLPRVTDSLLVKGLSTLKQRWNALVALITGKSRSDEVVPA